MSRSSATLLVGALLLASAAVGDEVAVPRYHCQGEQVTGFTLNKKTQHWAAAKLPPKQYLIQAPDRSPDAPLIGRDSVLVVIEVGDGDWSDTRFCKQDFDPSGELHCSGWGDDFYFNRETGRFLRAFPHGYIEGANNPYYAEAGDAPPFIEIGRCAPLKTGN